MASYAPYDRSLTITLGDAIFFHSSPEKERSPIRQSKSGGDLGIPNGWKPEPGFHLHFRNRFIVGTYHMCKGYVR